MRIKKGISLLLVLILVLASVVPSLAWNGTDSQTVEPGVTLNIQNVDEGETAFIAPAGTAFGQLSPNGNTVTSAVYEQDATIINISAPLEEGDYKLYVANDTDIISVSTATLTVQAPVATLQTLTLIVLDEHGAPMADLPVWVTAVKYETDAEGKLVLDAPNAQYVIEIYPNSIGYQNYTDSVLLIDESILKTINLVPMASAPPTYDVTFEVVDELGNPVVDYLIGVNEISTTKNTDESGLATFLLESGTYNFIAGKEGFEVIEDQIIVDGTSLLIPLVAVEEEVPPVVEISTETLNTAIDEALAIIAEKSTNMGTDPGQYPEFAYTDLEYMLNMATDLLYLAAVVQDPDITQEMVDNFTADFKIAIEVFKLTVISEPETERTLTIQKIGQGTVTPTVGQYVYELEFDEYGLPIDPEFTLSAIPASGWMFDKWVLQDSQHTEEVYATNLQLSLYHNLTATAIFAPIAGLDLTGIHIAKDYIMDFLEHKELLVGEEPGQYPDESFVMLEEAMDAIGIFFADLEDPEKPMYSQQDVQNFTMYLFHILDDFVATQVPGFEIPVVGELTLTVTPTIIDSSNPFADFSLVDSEGNDIKALMLQNMPRTYSIFATLNNRLDEGISSLGVFLTDEGKLEFTRWNDDLKAVEPIAQTEVGDYGLALRLGNNISDYKVVTITLTETGTPPVKPEEPVAVARTFVVKDTDNKVLEDVTIKKGTYPLGTTDSKGTLVYSIPNGEFTFTASKAGYITKSVTTTLVDATETITITVVKETASTGGSSGGGGGGGGGGSTTTTPTNTTAKPIEVSSSNGKANIDATEGKPVNLTGASVLDALTNGNILVVNGNGASINFNSLSLGNQALQQALQQQGSRLELGATTLTGTDATRITNSVTASRGYELMLPSVCQFTINVVDQNGDKTPVGNFNSPAQVSIDMKGISVDPADASSLTAVRLVPTGNGNYKMIPLGGKYDAASKTFKFNTDSFSLYTVVKMPELVKMELMVGDKVVYVNDDALIFDVAPMIRNNRTMVPVRIIAEALGADVQWNGATKTVTITNGGQTLYLTVDEPIPGFDATTIMENNRTFVPLRYVSEQLGANVMWHPDTKMIEVIK